MVVNVSRGLKLIGDWVNGSGDVPQDELGPALELEDAEGELVAAATLKGTESTLAREPVRVELDMDGAKMPAYLAKSSLYWVSWFDFCSPG
jgi:hypothetical protein